jgi:YVTN family beta-propeller protein
MLIAVFGRAQVAGPSFGEIVALGSSPSDLVLDELRGRIYAVNASANRVDIYNYIEKRVTGSILVGTTPIAAAISMDGATLYVTNLANSSLSVVDLASDSIIQTVTLPARPEGVAVGADGRVLITTQGTGTNNSQNNLLLFDRNQDSFNQVTPVILPEAPVTPAGLPPVATGSLRVQFPGKLLRTDDGQFIIGMVTYATTTNNPQTILFVYETASGIVLRNRRVPGNSTVLALSPDGARLMAGSTLYNTATLNVIAQMSASNLPFFTTANTTSNTAFNVQANFGGSTFSPDGGTVYAAFNTAATGQRTLANVLYVANPQHLGVKLGIRLPQSIVGRVVATSDGADAFAVSESGILHLPLSTLYDNPIVQPETTQVFLAMDECNKGVARAQLKVLNIGDGKASFSISTPTTALVTSMTSAVAPGTVDFVMDPGRSGVQRLPGTNLFTNANGGGGAPINITVSSAQAINFPNYVRVYMNYRQAEQRGIIYPRPVSWDNTRGLQEMLVDERRGRLYITNAGFNRLEVFDTRKQRFLAPVEVGQMPRSMAMASDGSTLYISNIGGESIALLDLDTMQIVGQVDYPPLPRAGNTGTIYPEAMAMGLSGLQVIMSNGTFWRVIGTFAAPRPQSTVAPATLPAPRFMIASPGGEYILAVSGNQFGYVYESLADTWTNARQIYNASPVSYFAPLAAAANAGFFVVGGMTLNSGLTLIGGAEQPGQTTTTVAPGQPPITTTVSAGLRHVAAAYPVSDNSFVRLTVPVRANATTQPRDDIRPTMELIDIRSGSGSVVAIAPDNPVLLATAQGRVTLPSPKQMAVDSRGIAYAITLAGLSVVPLSLSGVSRPPEISGGARGIVNASDGTASMRPGSFITVRGANLATPGVAEELPLPTVLGGTCVTFNDIAIPLIETAPGVISAQIPTDIRSGQNVVQVRSLATAQSSEPVVINVQRTQ